MRLLLLAALQVLSPLVHAERLTIERIFSDPDLNGPSPRALKIAPDGSRVTFLRGRADDQNQLDLWAYDVASGQSRRLVDSLAIGEQKELSDAEKARRERERIAQLKGIVAYRWAPDSRKLLFSVGERLWLYDLDARPGQELRALTPKGFEVNDAKVSPRGGYVSFVSRQNLYTIDLARHRNYQLTRDGKGPIHNGEAEFVAQEEMARATGYWWAPDDSAIAYERYDESGVDEVKRTEVYADRSETISQRYPAAGRPNVAVKLGLVGAKGGRTQWIDLGADADIYLARVDWLPDAKRVSFQRESRDQRRLDLIAVEVGTLRQQLLLTETSRTWINLHDDLRFLKHEDAFVWASERDGYKHLYVYGLDGGLRRALTRGDWEVDKLLALDEKNGKAYFASNRDDPLQQQVYVTRLDGADADKPTRISAGEGWHDAEFGEQAAAWIDTYSDPATPPQVSLRKADGSRIAWVEHNELKPGHPYWTYRDNLVAPSYGTLKSEDGQELHYRVYKPRDMDAIRPGSPPLGSSQQLGDVSASEDPAAAIHGRTSHKKYPVFMTYYGGPGSQYVKRNWGNHFEQYMAEHGYVVFAMDNRGSPRRGRKFSDAIFQQLGNAEIADQLAGIAWLKAQPWVDAKHIGVFGWSYGGYQTLMLLAKAGEQIAAGVAVAPVTDWTLYDTHYTERYLDTPQHNAQGYELSGVLHWIDGLKSDKLLLVHGMADDNVLFANSTKLMAALQQQGTQFRLMTYPGAKHGLSTPALKKHVYALIADYFEETLKPSVHDERAPVRAP
ncbi:S9 family peptidase [Dokdonella soli]|uniref:S9 family peptidase n=1 Tax=Dokdonella soli TaxID=529810 RepID=A0ABP3TM24_9GAMM